MVAGTTIQGQSATSLMAAIGKVGKRYYFHCTNLGAMLIDRSDD